MGETRCGCEVQGGEKNCQVSRRLDVDFLLPVWRTVLSEDLGSAASPLVYTDKEGRRVTDDRFAIGPSTRRQNVDDGRMDVDFDRGPCEYFYFSDIDILVLS